MHDVNGFGVPLSRARAWSAAALMLWMFVPTVWVQTAGTTAYEAADVIATAGVIAAVIARRPWARWIALGSLVVAIAMTADAQLVLRWRYHAHLHAHTIAWCAALGASALLLAPWRRRELGRTGVALACLGAAWGPATSFLAVTAPSPSITLVALAVVAMVAGGAGLLVRDRRAALALALAAALLAIGPMHHLLLDRAGWLDRAALAAYTTAAAALLALWIARRPSPVV